jgi:hypothetical protein
VLEIFVIQSKPLPCKAKYLSQDMVYGIDGFKNYDTNSNQCVLNQFHKYWLILSNVISTIISMIVGMRTNNFVMANHEMQINGLIDYGFVCLKFGYVFYLVKTLRI